MPHALLAEAVLLHGIAVEPPGGLELDAFVLHVHVERAVARADAAVAFDDPGGEGGEGRGERYCVPDLRAVAGCGVLCVRC